MTELHVNHEVMMEVGRLECAQERRVALVYSNFYASFVLSKLPAYMYTKA